MNHRPTPCSLCGAEAVAVYYLSHGCQAYPELTVQALCSQHEDKANPVGSMELLKDLRSEALPALPAIDSTGLRPEGPDEMQP